MDFTTIGYGGREPRQFVDLLHQHGVRTIVDVRLRPDRAAMGAYTLTKKPDTGLAKLLRDAGVAYVSLVELGNIFLAFDDWAARYAQLLETSGPLLIQRLLTVQPLPFALMCCEKRAAECHRRILADYLVKTQGWRATHIE